MIKKASVHEALIQHQNDIIIELEEYLKGYHTALDIDEEDTKDMDDLARQDSASDMLHNIELQLHQAKNDRLKLNKILPIRTEAITVGSLVITENYKFYISIPNHSFKVEKEEYIGIASDSPLYLFMKGKKEGDRFSFNKKDYLIKKVL